MESNFNVLSKKGKPKKSVVYSTYWKFAWARQNIFFNKLQNLNGTSQDDILDKYRFTNVYRCTDRVSQFLSRHVIYSDNNYSERDTLFRILLFKTFNKIETWLHLENEFGEINFNNYSYDAYNSYLSDLKLSGITLYNGAYILPSGKSTFKSNYKHSNHLMLLDFMFKQNFYDLVKKCKGMKNLFLLLKSYPTIGDFLAYQYCIDINYSTIVNFSENDFVAAGPGALSGIKKCFTHLGDYNTEDIIRMMVEDQKREFEELNLDFKFLFDRPLHLIDCQNLFCEVDKYARIAHPNIDGIGKRTRIKQKYKAKQKEPFELFFPPKWKLTAK